MDMRVIECCDDVRKVCATKEIALKEVLRMLREHYKENPDDKKELKDYRELMEQYFSYYRQGFYIDGLCWVCKAEFIEK